MEYEDALDLSVEHYTNFYQFDIFDTNDNVLAKAEIMYDKMILADEEFAHAINLSKNGRDRYINIIIANHNNQKESEEIRITNMIRCLSCLSSANFLKDKSFDRLKSYAMSPQDAEFVYLYDYYHYTIDEMIEILTPSVAARVFYAAIAKYEKDIERENAYC